MKKGSRMMKKLSAVVLMGAMLFWGQAIPAGAQSVPEDVAVEGLLGDVDPVENGQTFELPEWDDIEGADAEMSASNKAQQQRNCKKIKNKKKRKKCLKAQQEEQRIEREVVFEYVCPCVGRFQLGGLTGGDPNLGGGPIPVGAEDLYLTGIAEDASGTAISVNINQDDGTGANKATGSFCGESEEPIQLDPGAEIRVFIGDPLPASPVSNGCLGSVALGGTVTFTLSNLPPEDAPEEAPE
jgi:hypothetical protein